MPEQSAPPVKLPVVGIGASAGGIEALKAFFEAIPNNLGAAYIVVLHLAPDRKSELPAILARQTTMPVTQVADHDKVDLAPDHVYVIAPDRKLEIVDSSVGASAFDQPHGQRAAIDLFFRSLAASQGDGVAVVLSGSGSDGAVGAKAVKEAGGLVLVQDPREAAHDGMPRAVISTGCADIILPVRELAARLVRLVQDKERVAKVLQMTQGEPQLQEDNEILLRRILEMLRSRTGHDFSKYKRPTVLRRLARRMQLTHQSSFSDYAGYLRANPEEVQALFDDLLITVTTFFRDAEAWTALQQKVIAPLIEQADGQEIIRCWVPGCATGEEAYSLAILFREEMERQKVLREFIIFASDVDETALATARHGLYPSAISADVSELRLARFFHPQEDHYRVVSEVRDHVVFAAHSLLRDPPFSRLHLVSCRNLLIYLERELQEQVMELFRYACREDAYLFLGVSETADTELFRSVDKKHRIFQVEGPADASRHGLPALVMTPRGASRQESPRRLAARLSATEIHVELLESLAPPSLVVDEGWNVLHLSGSAARFLQQGAGSLSRKLTEIARPELRDEIHAVLHRAFEQHGQRLSAFVPVRFNGTPHRVGVLVQWRHQKDGDGAHALVTFLEAGEASEEAAAEQESNEQVHGLQDKLRQAEQRLHTMRDDHRLTNEDLRAVNEELQSLNEEYRSTTEELETSKEELQSINEELHTVNVELKSKLDEISRSHSDLENLMGATDIATLFLDRELRIKRFTPKLGDIFNVRSRDAGRPIGDFRHSLDYDGVQQDARQVLVDGSSVKREAQSRDGRFFIVRLMPYRTASGTTEGVVVTFVDVTDLKRTEQVLRESEERFRALVQASAQMVWSTDSAGQVVEDSSSWRAFTGQSIELWKGTGWLDAVHPDDRAIAESAWRQAIAAGEPLAADFRVFHAPSGQYRWTSVRAVPLPTGEGDVRGWIGMNIDVNELREALEQLKEADRRKDEFLAMLGHELRNPLAAMRMGIESVKISQKPDLVERVLAVVDRQSRHMERLINDLLDINRIRSGKLNLARRAVALCECIRDAAEALRPEFESRGIKLSLSLLEDPTLVDADPERLVQIVDNLLRNALTYTDRGGNVEVSASRQTGQAVVTVRDSGIGIDPVHASDVFEPYFQIDHGMRSSGLGLGLALVKRLLELHGGGIEMHSGGRGTGSEFRFSLPLSQSSSPDRPAEPVVAEGCRHRVLVVDDQHDVADSFADTLRALGQDVRVAYSAKEALETARHHQPRVAFLDLSMPEMDGAELAQSLRNEFPPGRMVIVALSGYGKKHPTAQRGPFDFHLLKPAEMDAIQKLLRAIRPD